MIKKYLVDINSYFYKSIILPLYEKSGYGFHIEGLDESGHKDLFPNHNKIKYIKDEIDIRCLPSKLVYVYLEDDLSLKAMLLMSLSKKYYLFKADHQKNNQLNIHQKYINDDPRALMNDYEKHLKNKGKSLYAGTGDFKDIKDIDYFENIYQEDVKKQLNKESSIYRLTFHKNNIFTADFVDYVEKKKIKITNIDHLDKKALTLSSMSKNINDRRDCLLIDSETKDIKYFIFTYKPYLIKHYLLFKNLGNDTYSFIKETICFNEIISSLKDITYKKASEFAARSFAKIRYENFSNEYILFEEEEEFEEEVINEIPLVVLDTKLIKKNALLKEVLAIVEEQQLPLNIMPTIHGKERILERIGEMSEKEMLALIKVAYEKGLTSAHFIEKDTTMFKFLQYQQNKRIGKTLRLYKDILFFFTLEPPHSLVTCFFYEGNYETYISKEKNN